MLRRWIETYYWLTPLFFVLDFFCGVSLRASAFDGHEVLKGAYYLGCLACAAGMRRWPAAGGWIGFGESTVNTILVVVGFVAPYFRMIGAFDENTPLVNPFTPAHLANFVVASAVAVLCSYQLRLDPLGHSRFYKKR